MKRFALVLVVLTAVAGGAAAATWQLSPTAREWVYLAGLFSGIEPVEAESASALVDHPTMRAAVALIVYTNLRYRAPFDRAYWKRVLEQPEETPDEQVDQLAQRLEGWGCLAEGRGANALYGLGDAARHDIQDCLDAAVEADEALRRDEIQVASRAVWTLCKLSGRSFGTPCDPAVGGALGSSLSDRQWSAALTEINAWGVAEFGAEALAMLGAQPGGEADATLQASLWEPQP